MIDIAEWLVPSIKYKGRRQIIIASPTISPDLTADHPDWSSYRAIPLQASSSYIAGINNNRIKTGPKLNKLSNDIWDR